MAAKKKPIGHHKHRYGGIVMGLGLIIAGVLWNNPWRPFKIDEMFYVLGVLVLIGGLLAYVREG